MWLENHAPMVLPSGELWPEPTIVNRVRVYTLDDVRDIALSLVS